jgi:hypothetical protein
MTKAPKVVRTFKCITYEMVGYDDDPTGDTMRPVMHDEHLARRKAVGCIVGMGIESYGVDKPEVPVYQCKRCDALILCEE